MPERTYRCMGLVLKKTKLGETDLIITLMAGDGQQVRAVAKGARKPTSSFASRLEVFSEVELLLARGRTLDIVKEADLVCPHDGVRSSLEKSTAAFPMVELLDRCTHDGLESPHLFEAVHVALSVLDASKPQDAPMLCAAFLLKCAAIAGFRPQIGTDCTCCGAAVPGTCRIWFSFTEGGVLCETCRTGRDAVSLDAALIGWIRYLIGHGFADISTVRADQTVAFEVLQFCKQWIAQAMGERLKSLDSLMTCGLF